MSLLPQRFVDEEAPTRPHRRLDEPTLVLRDEATPSPRGRFTPRLPTAGRRHSSRTLRNLALLGAGVLGLWLGWIVRGRTSVAHDGGMHPSGPRIVVQDSTSDTSRSSEAGIQQAPFPARPSDKKSVAVGEEISKAAELLATNRLREAARAYRQLASRFPQERVFELIASILERESRCEPENGWGDGGCG